MAIQNNPDASCDSGQVLIDIAEAQQFLAEKVERVAQTETVNLKDALGRVLANDLVSTINVPPANNSAMDGYAMRVEDLLKSADSSMPVSQRIAAGHASETLQSGTAVRIFTGAPIPEGADSVVMQEQCEFDESTNSVAINTEVRQGQNLRLAGEDIQKGDVILELGQKLRAQDIGLLASIGIADVRVFRRLRVAVFFTGDELREPGEALASGQIYNSNRYTLYGLLQSLGCEVIDLGNVEDTLIATKDAMQEAAQQADLVMTSGGVSVGEEDHIRNALEELGQLEMWRLNIKPGKPLAYGHIDKAKGSTAFIGLPGNPVSVFATFCIIARPYILHAQGVNNSQTQSCLMPSGFEWKLKGRRQEYVRVKLESNSSGEKRLQIYPNQSSGVLTSASWASGLAIIPANTPVKPGDMLEYLSFGELSLS